MAARVAQAAQRYLQRRPFPPHPHRARFRGPSGTLAITIRHAETDDLLALKGNHGTLHGEVRDLFADAEHRLKLVRGHRSIENQRYWVLDVVYGEDGSRIRSGHAARNLSPLCRLGHDLLRHDTTVKDSTAGNRKRACLCTSTLDIFLKLRESN